MSLFGLVLQVIVFTFLFAACSAPALQTNRSADAETTFKEEGRKKTFKQNQSFYSAYMLNR